MVKSKKGKGNKAQIIVGSPNIRDSTKSLSKDDRQRMNTTKTSNISQNSSQKINKNEKISPSKVKLDVHKEALENEEDEKKQLRNSSLKKVKKSKKQLRQEEVKVTDLMKIYGL